MNTLDIEEMQADKTRILEVEMLPKQIDFMKSERKEVLYSGAFRAGKTRALCYKLLSHAMIPGNFVGLCRKTYAALKQTTLRTLLKSDGDLPPVLPEGYYVHHKADHTISIHGGGEIYYFGFDDPKRLGSLGMGAIGIDEGTELDKDEYTMLMGRISNQVDPCRQVFTATNPGAPSHFLHKRFFKDKDSTRELIETNSFGNFFLPEDYIAWLKTLSGTDYERYALGKWTAYEGLVWQHWNRDTHRVHRSGPWKRIIIGFDEGFVHPAAIVVIGFDSDDRAHIIETWRESGVLPDEFVAKVKWFHKSYKSERVWGSPEAAALIDQLVKENVPTEAANNDVMPGIRTISQKLTVQKDGKPGLTVEPSCEEWVEEVEGYCWIKNKEKPQKVKNDLMDATRYALHSDANEEKAMIGGL